MTAFSRGYSDITENISGQFILMDQIGDTFDSISGIDIPVRLFLPKNLIFRELLIENSHPMTIWINDRLMASNVYACTIPIGQIYAERAQDSAVLLIRGIQEIKDLQGYLIGLNAASLSRDLNGTKKVNIQYDFLIMQVLVLLLIIGLMKRFDLIFLFNLVKRPFRLPFREMDNNFTFKGSYKLLLRVTFLSILLGISYWFLEKYQPSQSDPLAENLISWLIYSFYAFGLLLIKYIMVNLFGYLHQLKSLSHFQFSAFVDFTMGACLIFLIFVNIRFWFSFYEPNALTEFWNYYFLGAIILFYIYLFFYMWLTREVRKFHIISYLCSTEFLGIFYIALILIK
tara:strand:- start:1114 stop:2139 length:1026 start_codon:yes stop_codon:yes gene_type:complete